MDSTALKYKQLHKAILFCAIAFLLFRSMNFGGRSVDFYYMLADGQWILNHGRLPSTNVFSYIPGQKLILQQWAYCVLSAWLVKTFGNLLGTFLLVGCSTTIFTIGFVWFFREQGLPWSMAFLLTAGLEGLNGYHGVRPELLTLGFLMMEISAIERSLRTKQFRWLWFVPLTMALEMAFHGSMWPMHVLVLLPYLFPKQLFPHQVLNHVSVRSLPWKWGLFVLVSSVLALWNPYGLDGILYIFRSMRFLRVHGGYIVELHPIHFPDHLYLLSLVFHPFFRWVYGLIFTVILLTAFWKEGKRVRVSDLCILLGLLALSVTRVRQIIWMDIVFAILLSYAFFHVCEWVRNKHIRMNPKSLRNLWILCGLVFLVFTPFQNQTKAIFQPKDESITPVKAVQYLDRHEGNKILCFHDYGSFLQWKGYEVSCDSRPECYSKAIVGKPVAEDLIHLFYEQDLTEEEYRKTMKQYQGDYVLCRDRVNAFLYYLKQDKSYRQVVKGNGYLLFVRVDDK